MSALVSVIIRTRNRPIFLSRALASVEGQQLDDYELIIVNDGGEAQIVQAALDKTSPKLQTRTQVVNNQVSNGREAALESGLACASAPFFAIHDDDDTWDPQFLSKTVAFLQAHPHLGAVAARTQLVSEKLESDGTITILERADLALEHHSFNLIDMLVGNYIPPISQLIRRASADLVGHWDGRLSTQADWEFNLRLLQAQPAGFLEGPALAFWHQRPGLAGEGGNSVITAALEHQQDNLAIRESYLRTDSPSPALGQALVSAEYYRRSQAQLEQVSQGVHEALNLVHADLNQQVAALTEQVQQLSEQLVQLQELTQQLQEGSLSARLNKLRGSASSE